MVDENRKNTSAPNTNKVNKWPALKIAFVSKNEMIAKIFEDTTRSFRWSVVRAKTVEDAFSLIKDGSAFALAIEDENMPIINILRLMQFDTLKLSTPTMFISKRSALNDYDILKQLATMHLCFLPVTPVNMVAGFKEMIDMWEHNDFAAIRFVNYYAMRGEQDTGIQILFQVIKNRGISRNLAAIILALKLSDLGRPREAEQVLFTALREREKHLGCLFTLGYIYLRQGMPVQAKRLFSSAAKSFPNFQPLKQDLVQAEILLGDYSEAINHLNIMIDGDYDVEVNVDILMRLLLVKNLDKGVMMLGKKYPEITGPIVAAWKKFELQNMMQAG